MNKRIAQISRKTAETNIDLTLNLDGSGTNDVSTGVGFLDHMLDHLSKHSLADITIKAVGDTHVDDHHTTEDVAICIGEALSEALGNKAGIKRYGSASVPMDESLANVTLDLSGRSAVVFSAPLSNGKIGTFDCQLVEEFIRALARSAGINLHINVPCGSNDHHMAEAIFKALAMALRQAIAIDPARGDSIPSTKGML